MSEPIELVVCAIGKTGDGKSSLLNNILQKETFHTSERDGRVTTQTTIEHGFWLGNKNIKASCIDTPGFVDKNEQQAPNGVQILYDNLLTFIEMCSTGVNAFLIVFNVNHLEFDENYIATLDMFRIMFGSEFFKNCVIVFTFYDKEDLEVEKEARLKFVESVHHKLGFNTPVPCFFTSNKSQKGLGELAGEIQKMPRFDCPVMAKLREIQSDSSKTKLDQDSLIEKELFKKLTDQLGCKIL